MGKILLISPAKLNPKWGVVAGYEAETPLLQTVQDQPHLNFESLIASRPVIGGRAFLAYNSSFGNQYHILMEWLPTFLEFVELADFDATILLPESQRNNEALNAALDLLQLRARAQFIDDSSTSPVAFSHLYYSENLCGSNNFKPSKTSLGFLREIGRSVSNSHFFGPKRIYLSRADSRNRILENENELMSELCIEHDFVTLTISNMPFPTVVDFFMSAQIVVAPHGAGLVNLVFKGESDRFVCELMPQSYRNPCFQVLATALGDSYHAISLTDTHTDHHQHLLRTQIGDGAKRELGKLLYDFSIGVMT